MNRIELSSFIKIPMNEQESVLRWEAGEREFCFYTSDKNEIKKILRMMDEHPDDIRVKHADQVRHRGHHTAKMAACTTAKERTVFDGRAKRADASGV